jgi:hypothetical protein
LPGDFRGSAGAKTVRAASGDRWHRGSGLAFTDALDRLLSAVSRLDYNPDFSNCELAKREMQLQRRTGLVAIVGQRRFSLRFSGEHVVVQLWHLLRVVEPIRYSRQLNKNDSD